MTQPERIILNEEQKRLLRKLLSAKDSFEQLHSLAHTIEDNSYMKKEHDYLEEQAGAYDYIFWDTLEKLTGETIDTLYPASGDQTEEEEALREEAERVLEARKIRDIFNLLKED